MSESSEQPKENYTKRFDLGNSEVVRERLHSIQSMVRKMKESEPSVVSFLMYGSMVKGYATPESDIDGYFLIDTDEASKKNGPHEVEVYWEPVGGGDDEGINSIGARFKPRHKTAYNTWVRTALKSEIPELTDEQLEHINSLPISFETIDLVLKIWRESLLNEVKHKDTNGIRMSEYLSKLFFLNVGDDTIRKYRAHLIKKLFSFGQLGHEMWNKIIGFTEIMERKVDFSKPETLPVDAHEAGVFTDVRYPRTLEDAKRVYG